MLPLLQLLKTEIGMTALRSISFTLVLSAALLMLAHSAGAMGGQGPTAAVVIDSIQFLDLQGKSIMWPRMHS